MMLLDNKSKLALVMLDDPTDFANWAAVAVVGRQGASEEYFTIKLDGDVTLVGKDAIRWIDEHRTKAVDPEAGAFEIGEVVSTPYSFGVVIGEGRDEFQFKVREVTGYEMNLGASQIGRITLRNSDELELEALLQLVAQMAKSLEPFAEDPANPATDNAPCHKGLCSKEACGRCGRGIAAWEALALANRVLAGEPASKLTEAPKPRSLKP